MPEQVNIRYISDDQALHEALPAMQAAGSLAFDLEFDRDRHTYGFDLCLLQVASTEACWVIDPLTGVNLQPVYDLFADPAIRKLVHCPGEDLRLLHSLRCYPKNLADTEVMAKLLNYEQPSLSNLLQLKCGVILDKKLQKSNWHKRPLSDEQIRYAADDVIYLHRLYDILSEEVRAKGYEEFVRQEFDLLSETIYSLEPKTNFLRKGDLQYLSPYDQYVLNEVLAYRDALARQFNKPAHQIMHEDHARALAAGELEERIWSDLKGIYPVLQSHGWRRKIFAKLEDIRATATERGLSRKRIRAVLSPEERAALESQKAEAERWKTDVFQPIQERIAERFGEHAMRYLFSGAYISNLVRGEASLDDIRAPYRRALIESTASEFGFDLSGFSAPSRDGQSQHRPLAPAIPDQAARNPQQ